MVFLPNYWAEILSTAKINKILTYPHHSSVEESTLAHSMAPLETLSEWQEFSQQAHKAEVNPKRLRLFPAASLTIDLSGQRYSTALETAASQLLQARDLSQWQKQLLGGEPVNTTESRAAWHTMLRAPAPIAEVVKERERMNAFIRQADATRRWRHIVHIGIGGRSEEHTSELQSRGHLVCRLLLEKKKEL